MNLSWLDWLIVAAFLAAMGGVALAIRHYTRSVSDFLAGNRSAGRYLLTLSDGIAGMGLVGILANFEKFYDAGFAASWWGAMLAPFSLVIALSGWVIYRYRQTQALTLAQFFEMRYSRRFRIFAGIVAWVSGILNYGVFPGIAARFIVYFCGLPPSFPMLGLAVPTQAPVMLLLLGMALLLVLGGGMVTVMITDFFQAQFVNVAFLAVGAFLLLKFTWGDILHTLEQAPAGHSLVNPFDQGDISSFNVWFFAILAFKLFYNRLGWQGAQGLNSAAKSPHEARMAGILAEWRTGVSYLLLMLMPICAYVLLHGPAHAAAAAQVMGQLQGIADPQLREQMTVPLSLLHLLPAGVLGLLFAGMIAGTLGSDTTNLHSWGSIFIQDVILPFRGRHFTPEDHLRFLRYSILGVALFSFLYSLWFPLRDYIFMYFLVTGAIYLGGSGAVIIGGLYWRRGTTAGAWSAMLTGTTLALGGCGLRVAWPSFPGLVRLAPQFPLNGAWMALVASLGSIAAYAAVSLLTCRKPFDLDRMLHRRHPAPRTGGEASWKAVFGITPEFTRGDRLIYRVNFAWTAFWFIAFIAGTLAGLAGLLNAAIWRGWWLFTLVLTGVACTATVVWFLWGGWGDMRELLRSLARETRDPNDDGTVSGP